MKWACILTIVVSVYVLQGSIYLKIGNYAAGVFALCVLSIVVSLLLLESTKKKIDPHGKLSKTWTIEARELVLYDMAVSEMIHKLSGTTRFLGDLELYSKAEIKEIIAIAKSYSGKFGIDYGVIVGIFIQLWCSAKQSSKVKHIPCPNLAATEWFFDKGSMLPFGADETMKDMRYFHDVESGKTTKKATSLPQIRIKKFKETEYINVEKIKLEALP